jgi:ATP-binding cassette subfamily B protein
MSFILNALRPYRKTLILALALATINQVFSLLDPQLFRIIVDRYASHPDQFGSKDFLSGVGLLVAGLVGVALISRIAKNFQDYFVNVVSQRVGTSLYSRSVSHTFSLPYAVFEDQRSGEILRKMEKAKTDIQAIITSSVNVIFLSLVGILFVIIYSYIVHWSVGLTLTIAVPLLGVVTSLISRRIKAAQKAIVLESADLAGSTTETIRNVELVKSLGLERQEIERLNASNELILKLELKKIRMIRMLSFIQGTLINALRSGLMFLMLWLILHGQISLGEFLSLFIYSFFIFSPLAELGTVFAQYQEARASSEELQRILSMPITPRPANPVRLGPIQSVRFDGVGFQYGSSTEASLKGLDLVLRSGETIAFVGPSGSGKTTLLKLLLCLYTPTSGTILFNEHNAQTIDQEHFRERIGLVAQETQLFAGSIRDNLRFVRSDATDADCLDVLGQAAAQTLLERGGKGLDSKIGEGGIKLSGGERQRLAIARALLRNPDLLIFDEATSSLDSLTEQDITTTIKRITAERPGLMIVLVAHRLSTVAHADRIVVLERGSIIEEGKHADLVLKDGLYAALWREQSRGA